MTARLLRCSLAVLLTAGLLCLLRPIARPYVASTSGEPVVAGSVSHLGSVMGIQPTGDAGDSLKVTPTGSGAHLRSDFQRLVGDATRGGLWVTSTVANGQGHLRMLSTAVGRGTMSTRLARSGHVSVTDTGATFTRRGMIEEYSTGVDGVRQDFVVPARPSGDGALRVDLSVTGAAAAAFARGGVELRLDSGRRLAYGQLRVTDARGRVLRASMDVAATDQIVVHVDDTAAEYPVRIDPTFSDAAWIGLTDGMPGPNGVIYATAVDANGRLYVGGRFSLAGDVRVQNIAMWDGQTWSPMGVGALTDVVTIAVDGTDVYAGGINGMVGGFPNIAKWDGTAWSGLGTGMNNAVNVITIHNGTLYAGGAFTTSGGVTTNRIAKWDGSSWSALGAGANDVVRAIAVDAAGTVYAGGNFTAAGGVANTNYIAKWNGSAWSSIGNMSAAVYSLLPDGAGKLYAGGFFTTAGGVTIGKSIAKWDGSAWSGVGGGVGSGSAVLSMARHGSDLYVAGSFSQIGGVSAAGVARWNGSSWSAVGSGATGATNIAFDGNTLYVGGGFTTAGGVPVSNLASVDIPTSTWSPVVGPLQAAINDNVNAVAVFGGNLYVGGDFTNIGGVPNTNHIAKWTGTSWSAVGSGVNNSVYALKPIGSALWIGGAFTDQSFLVRWTGAAYVAPAPPTDLGLNYRPNNAVRAIEVDKSGNIYVGGDFTRFNGTTVCQRLVRIVTTGGYSCDTSASTYNGSVYALAADTASDAVFAGGNFTTPQSRIAQFNGTTSTALGTGMNNTVFALTWMNGTLYAGGAFTTAGGTAVGRIAMWNGGTWLAPGTGITGIGPSVRALANDGSTVYAGGAFSTMGGVSAPNIAQWDGSSWTGMGSGVSGVGVLALATDGAGHLFLGGNFSAGGSTVSPNVIEADLNAASNTAPLADAGADQNVAATSAAGATVTLDGSTSSDPEGDALTYTWRNAADMVVATTATATVIAPIGTNDYTLTVTDPGGLTSTDTVTITVVDVFTISIVTPPLTGAAYARNALVPADFSCVDSANLLSSCTATPVNGGYLDTATAGARAFTVTATNSLGDTSSQSRVYDVLPQAEQTITFPAPVATPYGASVTLGATATSGLAVTYTSLTPSVCTVSGAVVTPKTVGNCSVSASQAGDADWLAAEPVTQSFAILTQPVSASLWATGKTYDGTTAEPNVALSCTVIGLLPADAENVACQATGGFFDSPNAGSRVVSATVSLSGPSAGNYTFGVAGTTTTSIVATAPADIAKANSTTVVACGPSVTYTSVAQEVCSASVSGAGGLIDTATVTYTNNTNVGTASASATYAGDANHEGSTASATFSITAAPLSVVANDKTRAALAPNPVFDGTLTGVLGADGIAATYSGPTATLPGTYPIVPALVDPNGRLGNYDVSATNGTLTVFDADPPILIVPTLLIAEATGSNGAIVSFAAEVSATDAVFGAVPVTCAPASGALFPMGDTTVTCSAQDGAGNMSGASFVVTVVDTTAPTLSAADITVVATDAAGVTVEYAPVGQDLVNGDVASICSPTSGTVFAIGVHQVSCSATDAAGNVSATATFTVTVLDGVAPVVTVPSATIVEATSASGATVTFASSASDNLDETLTTSCAPASGSVFALGDTSVTCTATDAAGNSGTATFTVTVRDSAAPTLELPVVAPVTTATTTAVVIYTATASDVVDGVVPVTCAPASGSTFGLGNTTVACSATDAHGNVANGSFTVRVTDGLAPVVTVAPAGDRTVEATSASGATVFYTASASDTVDGSVAATCSPVSGTVFPIGATLVTCHASDAAGNVGSTTFTVMVVDTLPPVLTLPAPINVSATTASGAAVTYAVTAVDAVDGSIAPTCTPASGATFPVGATSVHCTAVDARGHGAAGDFLVTVTLQNNLIGRFVAFSRDSTRLRSQVTVVSGDIGANERRTSSHAHRRDGDDGDRDDITVQIGERSQMAQAGSKVVGDTVSLMSKASVYDVVANFVLNTKGSILGTTTSTMAVPYLAMPSFPSVAAGTEKVEVGKNKTVTLSAGSYGAVHVSNGGTLILTGGLYQVASIDIDPQGRILVRGASDVRVKGELETGSKSKIILDQSVSGLRASQVVFYVLGADGDCRHADKDDDGDDNGPATVHIGPQNVVQANIYAANGTLWLKSKTQATGAFIAQHVRIGEKVTLTLDSAFR